MYARDARRRPFVPKGGGRVRPAGGEVVPLTAVNGAVVWSQQQAARMAETVRLDVWLDVACLFKTRSEAQRACKGGKVEVNGDSAKPHRDVRVGDRLMITRPLGRRQIVVVARLAEAHVPKADARLLYTDETPAPTPAEVEARRLERIYQAAARASGRPDRRERRVLIERKKRMR